MSAFSTILNLANVAMIAPRRSSGMGFLDSGDGFDWYGSDYYESDYGGGDYYGWDGSGGYYTDGSGYYWDDYGNVWDDAGNYYDASGDGYADSYIETPRRSMSFILEKQMLTSL